MIDDRIKMLATTIHKLHKRGARQNIQKILAKTHIADIADMLETLKPDEAFAVFKLEPSIDKRSEIISYLEKEKQIEFIRQLPKVEVVQMVSLMQSDDVADLLGHLEEDESQEILDSMIKEDSEEVADLMGYPEDSAGGLMSSDFLALDQESTVQQAIFAIQSEEAEGAITFYLYVVNQHAQLMGIVSLKELLLSRPLEKLKDIMTTSVISLSLDTDQEDVAKTVEKYDFLSVPVVDDNNELMGVITVDDVIDVIREEAEEDILAMGQAGWGVDVSTWEHFIARLPWLILAFIGGGICFAIVYLYGMQKKEDIALYWVMISSIPLLLSLGAVASGQSSTLIVSAIRLGKFDKGNPFKYLLTELKLGTLFSFLFAVLVLFIGQWAIEGYGWNYQMSLIVVLQVFASVSVGALVPVGLYKMKIDTTIAAIPLCTVVSNILAVVFLFLVYNAV